MHVNADIRGKVCRAAGVDSSSSVISIVSTVITHDAPVFIVQRAAGKTIIHMVRGTGITKVIPTQPVRGTHIGENSLLGGA